jgi:hypothetical protein
MRKLHNVRKMTATTATTATTAPATNENDNVELANDLMLFVGLALDYTAHKAKALSCKIAMVPYIERYRASGYTTISAGAKGRSKIVPTPLAHELPYTLVVAVFTGMCLDRGISYDNTIKLSGGKTQWQNAKNQFLASFKLALDTGEWDNNVSRAASNETAEPKEKSARGSKERKAPTVDSVAKSLLEKGLTTQQLLDVLARVCKECSCDEWSYNVVKIDHPKKAK